MECVEKMGVSKEVSSFVLPLGATIILTATLSSIGTAGVDRIFDMGRTVVNITGDVSCCVVVHNLEKKKEMKKN